MPSTYSNLKIQLMATGENTTTWGNVTNTNLGTAIEEAIVGSADVAFSNANVTLTLTDTNSTQSARNMRLNLTGTATAGYNLVVPAIEKPYIVNNGTDGTITVKNTTGTGIAVPAGSTMWVYNNGTDVVSVVTYMTAIAGSNTSPSYTFAGDLNTGMWSPAADTIAFSEGGVEAMRIDSSGNVGIGTATPAQRLHVRQDQNGTTAALIQNRNGSGTPVSAVQFISGAFDLSDNRYAMISSAGGSNTTLQFWTGEGTAPVERMRVISNGNVGIGTSTPEATLDVNGGQVTRGDASGYVYFAPKIGTTPFGANYDRFEIRVDPAAQVTSLGNVNGGTGAARALAFLAGTNERMRIESDGDVGIGTSTPNERLTVAQSQNADTRAAISNQDAGSSATSAIRLAASGGFWDILVGSAAANSNALTFGISGTERMRITSAGNVGIGTTGGDFSRTWRFVARQDQNAITNIGVINANTGASAAAQFTKITGTGNSFVDWGLVDNSGSPYDTFSYGSAVQYVSWFLGGSERMRLNSSGNVGIGTTSPGYRLDIASGDTSAGLGYAMRVRSNATAAAATIQFTTSTVSAQNGIITCTDTGAMTIQSDGASSVLAFRTNGSEQLRILNTGGITSSNLADAVGYKGIPQNSQTATYTLALSDMGKHISITTGGVVIPANSGVAFPIGSAVTIFNNSGSSQTVSITTDTLRLAGTATTGTRNLAQYGIATVIKVTSTVWVISGAGVS